MTHDTTTAKVFNHHYGPQADLAVVDEMTDHPNGLLAGNPYQFDPAFPHLRRLFVAYIRAFQVWCDRLDAFREPPHPWGHPTAHQKRVYYRARGWHSSVIWSEKNVEVTRQKYLREVKRLTPGQRAYWECVLKEWREDHNRNLPHEPVLVRAGSLANYTPCWTSGVRQEKEIGRT